MQEMVRSQNGNSSYGTVAQIPLLQKPGQEHRSLSG